MSKLIDEAQVSRDDVIVHFTDKFDTLKLILQEKTFKGGAIKDSQGRVTGNADVSFTCGFDSESGYPLQILRKNRWALGLQFKREAFTSTPYNDAEHKLTTAIRDDLLSISDICKLRNGECFLKITARDIPIKISNEFYEYLNKYLRYQSKLFLDSHNNQAYYSNNSSFKKSIKSLYGYDESLFDDNTYLQFRTQGGGAKGVLITCKSDFQIDGVDRDAYLYGKLQNNKSVKPYKQIHAENYLNVLDDYKEQEKIVSALVTDLSTIDKHCDASINAPFWDDPSIDLDRPIDELISYMHDDFFAIVDWIKTLALTIEDVNTCKKINLESTFPRYQRNLDKKYSRCLEILKYTKAKITDASLYNDIWNDIGNIWINVRELLSILQGEESSRKDNPSILQMLDAIIDNILTTFHSPNSLEVRKDGSTVGGAPIYVPTKYMAELTKSIALDEMEFVVKHGTQFKLSDIDTLYFPKFYAVSDNIAIDMTKYCDYLKAGTYLDVLLRENKLHELIKGKNIIINKSIDIPKTLRHTLVVIQDIFKLFDKLPEICIYDRSTIKVI